MGLLAPHVIKPQPRWPWIVNAGCCIVGAAGFLADVHTDVLRWAGFSWVVVAFLWSLTARSAQRSADLWHRLCHDIDDSHDVWEAHKE
jgi:hypothetical protein